MPASRTHRIGRLHLDIGTDSLAEALAWRARAEELAWRQLPQVAGRVFDALAPAGLDVRIDKLTLELGTCSAHALDSELPAAFERALHAALGEAIALALHAPDAHVQALTPEAAALDELAAYLFSGTLPMRSSSSPFEPGAVIAQLIVQQPDALIAVLRRHAHDRHVIERLVLQIDQADKHGLLAALAPAHASLILAYLADFLHLHPLVTALRLAPPALQRALWVLTFEYLLHDAGSQFNRRSFLASLIEGVAAAEGISYAELLALLHQVARHTRMRQPLSGPLLGMLDELLRTRTGSAPLPAAGKPADAFTSAEKGELEPLLAVLRSTATQPLALATMLQAMQAGLFASLIQRLQPVHAALILAYVSDLAALHRKRPRLPMSTASFKRQLRMLVLRYFLLDPGSQFNRLNWLRRLLHELAASAGVSYQTLLASFTDALGQLRERMPLAGSLPEALVLLGGELALELAPPAAVASGQHTAFATLLSSLDIGGAPHDDPEAIARACPPAAYARLVEHLAPLHATAILADIAQLATAHQLWALLGDASLGQQLAPLALQMLIQSRSQSGNQSGGQPYARGAWLAALLQALAAKKALDYDKLVLALDEWRRHGAPASDIALSLAALAPAATHPPAQAITMHEHDTVSVLAQAERFLRTGTPPGSGASLGTLAAADPAGFSALLRRLLTSMSGNTGALLDRLLDWMLPEEVAAALLPGQETAAAHWAGLLAEQPGASMRSAWEHVLVTALRGDALQAPGALARPEQRLDDLALLRHLLDTGKLPWWASGGTRPDALLTQLPAWPFAALHGLFADAPVDYIIIRLQRLFEMGGSKLATAILARLAPWVMAPGGALAAWEHSLDNASWQALRIRATASAIAGLPLDLGQLASEPPLPPAPVTPSLQPPAATSDAQADVEAWLAWLAGQPGAARPASDTALRLLADRLAHADPSLDAALRASLSDPACRQRWADAIPPEVLARLVYRLAPGQARFMLDATVVILAAWRQAETHTPHKQSRHASGQLWLALLSLLAQAPLAAPRLIAARLLSTLATLATAPSAAAARLALSASELARQGAYVHLTAALQGASLSAPALSVSSAPSAPDMRTLQATRPRTPTAPPDGTTLYVNNAGLVLLHPFLPHFFTMLGVLTEDEGGKFKIKGTEAASRAVHLLQYLIDQRCDAPEPELALNKLLCGLPLDTPIARAITPDSADLALCEQMLGAVLGNWPVLGGTSHAGLREAFLQREGRLQLRDGAWTLTVSRKTIDVLLDQLSWGISVVLHRWMPQPLSIVW